MGTLSAHFDLDDVTRSETATRLNIPNDLPIEMFVVVKDTAKMMEDIRAYLSEKAGHDVPILVTSWYRCPELNAALRSSATSDHIRGCAVDWSAPSFGSPTRIAAALAPVVGVLGIGQLINEYPDGSGWVHTSRRMPDKAINRIITIKRSGTVVGVVA